MRIARWHYFQTMPIHIHVHFCLISRLISRRERIELREREQLNRVTITEPLTFVMERHTPQNDDIWIARKRRTRAEQIWEMKHIMCRSRAHGEGERIWTIHALNLRWHSFDLSTIVKCMMEQFCVGHSTRLLSLEIVLYKWQRRLGDMLKIRISRYI